MKEMMVMLAGALPLSEIADKMKEALREFQLDPTDNTKKDMVTLTTHLWILHNATNGDAEGVMGVLEKMKKFEAREKLFNPETN
jgi:hypothetical protein